MLALEIISLIAVLVMITVTIINIMYTVKLRKNIQDRNDKQDEELLKLRTVIASTQNDMVYFKKNLRAYLENRVEFGTRNYLERSEFNNLNGNIKSAYKTQIVDRIMPVIINQINNKSKGIDFTKNIDAVISSTINAIKPS